MTSTVLFIPLLNEGTEVWRPVAVEALSDGTYKILGPKPEDEEWAFPPGSIVASELKTFSEARCGPARQAAPTRRA